MAAPAPVRPRLPLTVIGGFLGSGKTTLLNRLLRDAQGRRLAVLVNDFGALNIDAELIASSAGDTIALSNGCICCSIGDGLTAALIKVIEAETPFDAVFIEASGVADPWRIAQVALADPALGLEAVVVLVDTGAALAQWRDPLLTDTLERQLKAADLVVLNKTDLADAETRSAVRRWVESVAGSVPQFETTQAGVPLALLGAEALDRAHRELGLEHEHGHAHEHGHEHHGQPDADAQHRHDDPHHDAVFETWSHRPQGLHSAAFWRAQLRAMPAGLLRLKGLLRTDELGWTELQFAGRHGSLRRAMTAPADDTGALVAIGLAGSLPRAALDDLCLRALQAVEDSARSER